MTPNPSRPAAVDALQAIDDAIEELIECRVDVAIGNMKGDHSGGWKKLPRPLKRKLMEQIAALAAHHGPAAVDEAMARVVGMTPGMARVELQLESLPEWADLGDTVRLAKPAQEAAPRGGGEADGRAIRVSYEKWYRLWEILDGGPVNSSDAILDAAIDRLTAPPAAQASDHPNTCDCLDTANSHASTCNTPIAKKERAQASDTGRKLSDAEIAELVAKMKPANGTDWRQLFVSACEALAQIAVALDLPAEVQDNPDGIEDVLAEIARLRASDTGRGEADVLILREAVEWARAEFEDKRHVAECRADDGLARYYALCRDKMDEALATHTPASEDSAGKDGERNDG